MGLFVELLKTQKKEVLNFKTQKRERKMKYSTSKKAMKENFNKIVKIGYCKAQYLLNDLTPIAYSTGAYGWSCDYYQINDIVISTGYAPIGTAPNYELLKEYEKKACNVDYNLSWEERKEQRNTLLLEFLNKVI